MIQTQYETISVQKLDQFITWQDGQSTVLYNPYRSSSSFSLPTLNRYCHVFALTGFTTNIQFLTSKYITDIWTLKHGSSWFLLLSPCVYCPHFSVVFFFFLMIFSTTGYTQWIFLGPCRIHVCNFLPLNSHTFWFELFLNIRVTP